MGEEILGMNNIVWLAWRYFLEGETRRKWGPKIYDIFQYVGREALLSLEIKAQRTSWLIDITIESLIWVICPISQPNRAWKHAGNISALHIIDRQVVDEQGGWGG